MAKKPAAGNGHRTSAVGKSSKARSPVRESRVKTAKRRGPRILFPTEPSTIGNEKIYEAVMLVLSRRK